MHYGTDAGTGSHPKRAKISDFPKDTPQRSKLSIFDLFKQIRHNIVSSVPQHWSLLADETQDCSICYQVSLCIQYVKENEVCEDFLDFVQMEKIDAQ